jgi:chromosome segregation ATPase
MAEQAFDLMACLKGYDERIRQLEASKYPGFAHVRTAKRTVDDGNGVTHEESFSYQPRFSIADRDAKIKGLEAELEAQRMHYQGELEKARKAIDALASEHIREHKRRVEVEDTISKLQETIEMYQKASGFEHETLLMAQARAKELEVQVENLTIERARDQQAFETFGIRKNGMGYWQPK